MTALPPDHNPSGPAFGLTEWFRPGDHDRVHACLDHMAAMGVSWLRTHLSWADYHAEGGQAWYDWLLPTLAARVEVLPCIHYTPPSLSVTGTASGPPRRPRDLADFERVLRRRIMTLPGVGQIESNVLLSEERRPGPL